MSIKPIRDVKVKGIKLIENKYDVDIGLYNEVGVNMKNSPKGSDFQGWMGDHGKSRCVMAYNVNDESAKTIHQPGGTATIIHGSLVGRIYKKEKETHGRWTSYFMYRQGSKPICFITAYMPCVQNTPGKYTYTHQL